MNLSELPKLSEATKKRIGRGHGSGRGGHTSTRGAKGERARGKIGLFFIGTKTKKSIIKRLPFLRGKGKFKPVEEPPVIINLNDLSGFKEGERITVETLQEKGVLPKTAGENLTVRLLGEGEVKVALTVALPSSKSAREKIEKVGGKVVENEVVSVIPQNSIKSDLVSKEKTEKKVSRKTTKEK